MNRKVIYFISWLFIAFCACKKDKPDEIKYSKDKGVFICNEGNFTYGNASLSFYDTETGETSNQVFFNANGFPVGDVLQSMAIHGNKGYLVVNNSGKVFVINTDDFTHFATISGLTSPRYIEFIDDSKAYVSDLYSSSIAIINPATCEITGYVNAGTSTEQMVKLGEYVFVASWSDNNKILKINCVNDILEDSLTIAWQPNSLAMDKNDMLWALSDGNLTGAKDTAALTCINTNTFTIEKVFTFPDVSSSPSRLCINSTKDTLFYINGSWGGSISGSGVCKMPVDAQALPSAPIISEDTRLFYGLDIDPETSVLYVTDAIDYVQNGWVFRYTSTGAKIDSFKVDIVPGAFCFKF